MTRVDVWSVDLAQPPAVVAELDRHLSEDERDRARASLDPSRGERYTVAHGALREVLASYAAVPPDRLELGASPSGKPLVAGGDGPHFSLSHSAELALVAVSPDRPVGVDLEWISDERDVDGVARRAFGPAELAQLAGAHGRARYELFFRVWTCKEACLKEGGRGIAGLTEIEVAVGRGGALSARDGDGAFAVAALEPAPGYAGAVAARGGEIGLELKRFDAG
jgi:4'-phosphopantetheinyl transferase